MRFVLLALLLAACARGDGAARDAYAGAIDALRQGHLRDAAARAEQAAADPAIAAHASFLRGNVAFAQCVKAHLQAKAPEAEPFAFDVAIRYGEDARDRWQDAAMSRDDWPAARRNVERALMKLAEIRRDKEEADRSRRREKEPTPKPKPQPTPAPDLPPPPPEQNPEDKKPAGELSSQQVLQLLETLKRKEEEKLALRRAEREAKSGEIARDW